MVLLTYFCYRLLSYRHDTDILVMIVRREEIFLVQIHTTTNINIAIQCIWFAIQVLEVNTEEDQLLDFCRLIL